MTVYAIFGAGRVGQSMRAYLTSLDHAVRLITHEEARDEKEACRKAIESADIVAAAVPDDALKSWKEEWSDALAGKIAIHFSGATRVDGVYAYHPLFSFPREAVAPEALKTAAFACPVDGPSFAEVFPGAPNRHFKINDADRARYHALAVLTGNYAAFIWNECAREISDLSGIAPEEIMSGYLSSVLERFTEAPLNSITGPVARRDRSSVEANLASLQSSPKLQDLYRSFLNAAWPDYAD